MNVKKNAKLLEHNMARHHKYQYKRAHKLGARSTGPKRILSFAYPFTKASERLQRVVHWSKTTYPEVVSHSHGQHDFYVEHAQPELRLRILYTKMSLTWSLVYVACSDDLCEMQGQGIICQPNFLADGFRHCVG